MSWLRRVATRVLKLLLGPYAIYRIFAWDAPALERRPGSFDEAATSPSLAQATDPEVRRTERYAGPQAAGFTIECDGETVGACWYWWGDRYRTRGFWPLAAEEAKLVQITTAAHSRGKGLGTELIRSSARAMADRGFRRIFARVWHSNTPSCRAFEKAGWRQVAFVIEVRPFSLPWRWRWVRRREG